MPAFTFVRHGQSTANREGWMAGHLDAPLTDLGVAQAIEAREEVLTRPFARAFSSDLSRAHRTAELILEHADIPLQSTPRLRERSAGRWQGRTVEELQREGALERDFHPWTAAPPDGESLEIVARRAIAFLAEIEVAELDTLVVAHGALIRAVMLVVDDLPRDRLDGWRPRNCEAVTRTMAPGKWAKLHHTLVSLPEPGAPRG